MSPGRAVSIPCWRRGAGRGPMSGSQRRCPTYSISVTFSIGDFFTEHRVNSQQKNPGRSRGQTASNRLAVLLLSALALSALTALSGLLLLLAWLLLAAAALLLARLVLAALLLAGVLLVRIVHNVSYFGFSPVMTTIVTPLGCSRSELNSERTKFREGAGGYEGESRSRAAEEKPSGSAAP